jgi:hypothetical protein
MPRTVGLEVASRLAAGLSVAGLLVGGALPAGNSVHIMMMGEFRLGSNAELVQFAIRQGLIT